MTTYKTLYHLMVRSMSEAIDLYDEGKGILAREVLKKALLDAEDQVISHDIIPDVAAMETQMKKYKKFFKTADGKQKALEKKNDELTAALEKSEKESTVKKLQEMRLHSDYERIKGILDRIPPEIIRAYTHRDSKTQEVRHYR